jgi:hypothetical protein
MEKQLLVKKLLVKEQANVTQGTALPQAFLDKNTANSAPKEFVVRDINVIPLLEEQIRANAKLQQQPVFQL